jgi:hypothetical protein
LEKLLTVDQLKLKNWKNEGLFGRSLELQLGDVGSDSSELVF